MTEPMVSDFSIDTIEEFLQNLDWKFQRDLSGDKITFSLGGIPDKDTFKVVLKIDSTNRFFVLDIPEILKNPGRSRDEVKDFITSANLEILLGKFTWSPSLSAIGFIITLPLDGVSITFEQFRHSLAAVSSTLKRYYPELKEKFSLIDNKVQKKETPSTRLFKEHTISPVPCCRDLAKEVELDATPIIGRDTEASFLVRNLLKKERRNVIITGHLGAGRASVVKRMIQEIENISENHPAKNWHIISLDISEFKQQINILGRSRSAIESLIKGSEQNFLSRFFSAIENTGEVILFIDGIYPLITQTKQFPATLDIFRLPLQRSILRIVGTATFEEYRRLADEYPELLRYFTELKVNALSPENTVEVLFHSKKNYEQHFEGVEIDRETIEFLVERCTTYMKNEIFPEIALDVLDDCFVEAQLEDKAEVDEVLVTKVIKRRANIPLERFDENLKDLQKKLEKKVIGQSEAIRVIENAIINSRVSVRTGNRPQCVLLFLGATGIGKTELCKQLAKILFEDENRLLRFDMSEYQERSSINKLIGSPPGYEDSEAGGNLTNFVMEQPYSILLFDEIEKAHPSIHRLLLQVLDEGRLTDARGRPVDFSNTFIFMTTNRGSRLYEGIRYINAGIHKKWDRVITRQMILEELRRDTGEEEGLYKFPTEFLGRIQDAVVFRNLSRPDMLSIAALKLNNVLNGLVREEKQREHELELKVKPRVYQFLTDMCSSFGVRDLEAAIKEVIEYKLSRVRWSWPGKWKKVKRIELQVGSDYRPLESDPTRPIKGIIISNKPYLFDKAKAGNPDIEWKYTESLLEGVGLAKESDFAVVDLNIISGEEEEDKNSLANFREFQDKFRGAIVAVRTTAEGEVKLGRRASDRPKELKEGEGGIEGLIQKVKEVQIEVQQKIKKQINEVRYLLGVVVDTNFSPDQASLILTLHNRD